MAVAGWVVLFRVLGLSFRGTLGTEPLALGLRGQPHTLEVEPLYGTLWRGRYDGEGREGGVVKGRSVT